MNIFGSPEDDYLIGSWQNDHIYGYVGRDYISGGGGDDIIDGGWNQDILRGGSGNDIFVFSSIQHSNPWAPDTIQDFSHGHDKVDLSALHTDFSHVKIYARRFTVDINGDGVVDMAVQVNTMLKRDDFIFLK